MKRGPGGRFGKGNNRHTHYRNQAEAYKAAQEEKKAKKAELAEKRNAASKLAREKRKASLARRCGL